jgi:hypothetical protein
MDTFEAAASVVAAWRTRLPAGRESARHMSISKPCPLGYSHVTQVVISWFRVIRHWWRRAVDAKGYPLGLERFVGGSSDLGADVDRGSYFARA